MNQKHRNDPTAEANFNMNNNISAQLQKPVLPSKPSHLKSVKTISKDCITPKGWSSPTKFTSQEISNVAKSDQIQPEGKPVPKWRPAPRLIKKQDSVGKKVKEVEQQNVSKPANVSENEQMNTSSKKDDDCEPKTHAKSLQLEGEQLKEFSSLKRMWSKKSKEADKLPVQLTTADRDIRNNEEHHASSNRSCDKIKKYDSVDSSTSSPQSLSRSTSSSSNGSLRTASFKDRQATWHYVTTNESAAGAHPLKMEPNESSLSRPVCEKKFDHSILAPRPFRATSVSFDELPSFTSINVPKSRASNKSTPYKSHNERRKKSERQLKRQPSFSEENESSSSSEEVDSDEKEMQKARKLGKLVTRFDSTGNMYSVNPRSGEVSYIKNNTASEAIYDVATSEKPVATLAKTTSQKVDFKSKKTSIASENHHKSQKPSNFTHDSSSDESPPPLLPRAKVRPTLGNFVPRTSSGGRQSSMTSMSMYPRKNLESNADTSQHWPGDLSPESNVPPPILPRGQQPAPTQDYTPMSGSTGGSEMLNIDKGRPGSSASLNSILDHAAYQPMGVQGGSYEPMGPNNEEDIFNYSSAVQPSAQPEPTIREYHEIDPDPDVPIADLNPPVLDPKSVPPPPNFEPPTLPKSAKPSSDSPPPLPPLNTGQRKLNYVEVETGNTGTSNIRGKSKKTNYTEVVVGEASQNDKNDSNVKKGKSGKGGLFSKLSGYLSEGDAVSSKNEDDERTTDFAKERNKLKRLSGRILRKKKRKSRDYSHQHSTEIESSVGKKHGNVAVGIYASATNLSTTSSESSRSLAQVASSNSGSSGDGQARLHQSKQGHVHPKNNNEDRRQSYESASSTQLPPKLEQKSRSEIHLDSAMHLQKSHLYPHHSPQLHSKSAGNTPDNSSRTSHKQQRSDVGGSPVPSTHNIQSYLHSRGTRPKVLPPSPRPVSEPPVVEPSATEYPQMRPMSTPYDLDSSRRSRLSQDMVKVLSIHPENSTDQDKWGQKCPTVPPPPPPHNSPPQPGVTVLRPPSPNRDKKPDRFKKRASKLSGSEDYTAADDMPVVPKKDVDGAALGNEHSHDPIYDDVEPGFDPSRTVRPRNQLPSISKLLESEPLYQVYRSRTLSHASTKNRAYLNNRKRNKSTAVASKRNSEDGWHSELMTDDAGATTLWKEVKEVVESGIGQNLTNNQMKLQQAQFEVVSSQASYMRSLNILIDHFMNDWAMESADILPKKQRKELFSNIVAVRDIEQRFLQDIEQHFWDNLYLTEIANITAKYATLDFEVYVRYVQNQVYQDRVLTELQRSNEKFAVQLQRLESSPSCNKLPLLSFLLLPMQRVTRLPLLISAIVNQADASAADDENAYKSAKHALGIVNKLVKKCNEGARKMQQIEQLAEIARDLVFSNKVKTYALVSQSRHLVKKGEMSVTMFHENKKAKVLKLWLFLLSDVLLLARKKNFLESGTNVKYEVINWSKRAMLFVNEQAVSENEIFLVLLEDSSGKRVELALSPVSQNELTRWTEALNPRGMRESEDSIYETWDCPQFQCITPYHVQQPDELALDVGDVMKVFTKTGDGWLEGERLSDNETGWFPAENCEEIDDEHVRARNLRNLYRIIPFGEPLNE